MKFGGTSVASGENIRQVTNLVAKYVNQGYKVVAVISAIEGVTDDLIEASEQAKKGNKAYTHEFVQRMMERHVTAAKKAIESEQIVREVEQILETSINELEKVLTGIVYLGELTAKSRDYVLSFGEKCSTPIVCAALRDIKLEAQYFTGGDAGIVTDSNFGEACPLMNVTKHQIKETIEPILEQGTIPVVTGYIAVTQDGVTTTFGRGGSDYTATIIGAALGVDEVWMWTDVDGLMTSDPKIVPSARMLPELSFQEATEMAITGAKAMHPKALEPAVEENIPIRIRNVFNPENPGTLLVKEQKIKQGDVVKAVTLVKDVAMINVSGAAMFGVPGSYAKIFEVLGRHNINIMMISAAISEVNLSLAIRKGLLEKAVNALEMAFLGRGLINEVTAEEDVCVVAIVGAGMKGTPGVASRIFKAIAEKGINIRMIAQGSSELNISLVVKETDGQEAIRAIHEEFNLDKI
jgi:aspartate kinase